MRHPHPRPLSITHGCIGGIEIRPLQHQWRLSCWVLAGVAMLLAVTTPGARAEGQTAVIRTTDGSTYEGELVRQTAAVVVINVGGIDAPFKQSDIAEFEIKDSPEQVYRRERRALDDNDLLGRLALARKMLDLEALKLAKLELSALDRDFPEHPEVQEELALVEARMRLQTQRSSRSFASNGESREGPQRVGESDEYPFLSPGQINLIKVYEIDLDAKPRVSIPAETIDSFFQKYSDHRDVPRGPRERSAFKRQPGYEQLATFFQVQARDLYDQVEVRQEPDPLMMFRRVVNPNYVARYFAPMFAQGQIQGLHLFNQRTDDEAEAYTNFYLLTEFFYDGKPLIDRVNPDQSLLLQWGLTRESARSPAPDVEGWRPAFRSIDDAEFRRYAEWIGSLYTPEPDYGIVYRPDAQGE